MTRLQPSPQGLGNATLLPPILGPGLADSLEVEAERAPPPHLPKLLVPPGLLGLLSSFWIDQHQASIPLLTLRSPPWHGTAYYSLQSPPAWAALTITTAQTGKLKDETTAKTGWDSEPGSPQQQILHILNLSLSFINSSPPHFLLKSRQFSDLVCMCNNNILLIAASDF